MEKETLLGKIKSWIASKGFKLFLWGNDISEEDYWESIYQQEKAWKIDNHKEL